MELYRSDIAKEEKHKNYIWDAFVNHLETIYFIGAAELLDKKTIAFELESFNRYFIKRQ